MIKLGVNIDHIATIRQARGGVNPAPLAAALVAEKAGADGITVHLREDRRHIQDFDVINLRKNIKTRLNLEMALAAEIVGIALKIKPDSVCIVPEKRKELTTEGGLDVISGKKKISRVIKSFKERKIIVSLFIDPDLEQVEAARDTGADYIELHTGEYANAITKVRRSSELARLKRAGKLAVNIGLGLNAGHGLDYDNVQAVSKIPGMHELNIGHSIIARAVMDGLGKAVKDMKKLMNKQ